MARAYHYPVTMQALFSDFFSDTKKPGLTNFLTRCLVTANLLLVMFTVENARFASDKAAIARNTLNRPKPIAQAVWFQDRIREAAANPETTPAALAQLARAWEVIEERKAILRGIGAPKPVVAVNDPLAKSKKPSKSAQSFSETGEDPKAPKG